MENDKLTVYLAGPIQDCSNDDCKVWREYVTDKLPDIDFLDPMRRDYRTPGDDEKYFVDIIENDKKDIEDSDVVLVYHDRPSVGTSMEILYAFDRGVFVLTVHATGKPLSPWILYHSSKIVATLDEAIEELKKVSEQYNVYEVHEWDDM